MPQKTGAGAFFALPGLTFFIKPACCAPSSRRSAAFCATRACSSSTDGGGGAAGGVGRSFTLRRAPPPVERCAGRAEPGPGPGGAASLSGPQLIPPPRSTARPASDPGGAAGASAGAGAAAAAGFAVRGAAEKVRVVEPDDRDFDAAVPLCSSEPVRHVDAVLPPSALRQLALRRMRPSRRGASRTA